ITAKTNALAQASMKLGEAMYKQAQEGAAAGGPGGAGSGGEGSGGKNEDGVDAEFTEGDDDKKNKKTAQPRRGPWNAVFNCNQTPGAKTLGVHRFRSTMSDRVGFDDAAAEMTGVDAGMAKRCYYDVLGVERTADDGELKSAFRKLAMKWHPDRNPSDKSCEVRFKEINEAYEILKDPDKRAAYDRFGHAAFEHAGPGAAHGFGDVASAFADIFDDLFGMGGGRRGRGGGRERGADLRYNMEITLEEAYCGKTAQVRIPTSVTCEGCSGSGAKTGTKPKACPTCGGQGRIRHAQGFFTLERTCPACQGRGQVIDNPCPSCSGSGWVTRERALSVNIPAGVEAGTRIRLAGEGEAGGRGGAAGDLHNFLALRAHTLC